MNELDEVERKDLADRFQGYFPASDRIHFLQVGEKVSLKVFRSSELGPMGTLIRCNPKIFDQVDQDGVGKLLRYHVDAEFESLAKTKGPRSAD